MEVSILIWLVSGLIIHFLVCLKAVRNPDPSIIDSVAMIYLGLLSLVLGPFYIFIYLLM